jgi:hypothetical protein
MIKVTLSSAPMRTNAFSELGAAAGVAAAIAVQRFPAGNVNPSSKAPPACAVD